MIGDTVGYASITKQTTTENTGCKDSDLKKFQGQTVRVIEFDSDGGAMVISQDGQTIATFDICDIRSKFECCVSGEVLCPPKMKDDTLAQMAYATQVLMRKGGYNNLLKQMVIAASIHRGTFSDNILWAKQ